MLDRDDLEIRRAVVPPTTLGEFLFWISQDFVHALEAVTIDLLDERVMLPLDWHLGSASALLYLVVGDGVYYERGRILTAAIQSVAEWVDARQGQQPAPVLVCGDDWLNAPDRPGYFDTPVGLARLRREARETGYIK